MSLDACLFEHFEIVNRGAKIGFANSLYLESYAVLSRIENAILAGAIVLKLEKHVAIVELVNVLGLAFVSFDHCITPLILDFRFYSITIFSACTYFSAKKIAVFFSFSIFDKNRSLFALVFEQF
jgi:hypothetical protein